MWMRFKRWWWARSMRRHVFSDSAVLWEDADRQALTAFMRGLSGRRLELLLKVYEQQCCASAVQQHKDLPWASGYACGIRAAYANLNSLAALSDETEKEVEAPVESAVMGAEDLRKQYAP